MRILVVDDDEYVLKALRTLLGEVGFEIGCVRTGEKALEAMAETEYDLILLDVRLPNVQGIEVCRQLKTQRDHFLPIILITGYSTAEAKIEGLESGADDYLVKPFDNRELLARVKSLLRIKALHDEVRRLASVRQQIISTMTHDYRTPLVGIRGAVQNLLSGLVGPLTPEQREYLDLVDDATCRLSDLTEELCLSARGRREGEITSEAVDIVEAVKTAVRAFRPELLERKIEFSFHAEDDVPSAWGEKNRLVQAIANLLDNAVKHSPDGAKLSVEVRREATPRGLEVHLVVSDEGPGIARSDFERIFYRFEQVGDQDPEGTGMGLAICRDTIDAHRGRVWVESEPGSGARFHISLPGVAVVGGAV